MATDSTSNGQKMAMVDLMVGGLIMLLTLCAVVVCRVKLGHGRPNVQLQMDNVLSTSSMPVTTFVSTPMPVQDQAAGNQQVPLTLTPFELDRGMAFAALVRKQQSTETATRTNSFSNAGNSYADETKRLIGEIKSEAARLNTELGRLEDEIKKRTQAMESESKKRLLAIDFAKEEPRVRHYLSALTTHGYSQPKVNGYHELSTVKGPVSLKALIACGALVPTNEGLQRLGRVGSEPNNDRGLHAFPAYSGAELVDHRFKFLLVAQELLLKYQSLLVDKGLLAP